jgi:hypothetical protein
MSQPIVIVDGAEISGFVAKAWTATEYPTTEWPDDSFAGWTDQPGPFELWQEVNGHVFAKAGDGAECPEMFPVTIAADGSIRGFYAIEGQCHIGYLGQGVCVPPTLDTEFTEFHEKPIRLASGANLDIGFGTALDDHVSGDLPGDKVVQVQVDLSTLVCALRATYYPGAGIWLSGHMLPGVDESLVAAMRLGYPSGHWAADTGEHSLRIFHWVTKPGYAPKWYVPRAGDAGVVTASVMLPGGAARQGETMSDVESVQAGSVYVIKPIVGPRESERVRWPDGVGRFASLEDATDGASFYRVQPEIDGLLSDEYALVPVADAELTGEVYEWGYQDEDSPDGSPFGTKIVDEAPSTHETVAAACCSTCAQNGGTCAGRKKKKMVAAEIDNMETIDGETPDLASMVAELSARLDAKYDELNARLLVLETEETTEEDETDMGDEPMTASVAAFPESVLAAISANV